MFRRERGCKDRVGKVSPEYLLKKSVHLFCFVSRLFGIIITENKWKYEWKNNGTKLDDKGWKHIFILSQNNEVFDSRWNILNARKKCQ